MPTPDQQGVNDLRLPAPPHQDLNEQLTIEAREWRIW